MLITRDTRNKAFTLIELLVVVAIIGVLAGLTLAGVQKVRSLADRTACSNHIRQLALALHQHHDLLHRFPAGHQPLLRSAMPLTGWTIPILPFIEQASLHDASVAEFRTRRYPLNRDAPHAGLATVVPLFLCPSDHRIKQPQISRRTQHMVAFTSFLGVAGQNRQANDGMLYQLSATRIDDATDGASQTLLLGERPPSADFQFGWWYAGTGQNFRGTADLIMSVREPNLQRIVSGSPCGPGIYPFRAAKGFDDPCGMFHFWSPHPGGAHFAFTDGSVRFLRYTANDILPALATRAGGESVEVP